MPQIPVKNVVIEWLLGSPTDMLASFVDLWGLIRASYIVPIVRASLFISLVMSTMLLFEWFYIGAVVVYVKLFKRTPERRYKWESIGEDSEIGNVGFPMVLVQIPLHNEKEVYKLSIGAACNLSWPADRLLIQVIDGSTDVLVKDMVEKECNSWAGQGINIRHQIRKTIGGFKAGALKEGLSYDYVKDCDYVAIFDADFQPPPDFLTRTVPFLVHNPEFALVQARWKFVNADECLLTRFQEMYLDYHFIAEQEVGSSTHAFFGFNGSGGIWKLAAINEAGGWDSRTTAEDMDLAVRAALKGWKLVYMGDLEVNSELPSTFKAYCIQQHRWACGPNNLFRKIFKEIAKSKEISIWKRFYMIYNFFFVRKILGHTCIFFSYCIVLPLTILIPEVNVPKWGAVFIPCILAAINSIITTPRSLHLIFLWILFENAMSIHLTKAIFTGLFGAQSANEWIVTVKHGDSTQNKTNSEPTESGETLFEVLRDRILLPQLGFAVFLFISGWYGFFYRKDYYFIYLFLQAIAFTIVGFGFIGKRKTSY